MNALASPAAVIPAAVTRTAMREVACFKCGRPGIVSLNGAQHDVCAEHLYAAVKVVDVECDTCGSIPCSCGVCDGCGHHSCCCDVGGDE